jgi:hypothetical protein
MVMVFNPTGGSLRSGDLVAKTECGGYTGKSEDCRLDPEYHLDVSLATDKLIAWAWKSRVSFFEVEGSARLLDVN